MRAALNKKAKNFEEQGIIRDSFFVSKKRTPVKPPSEPEKKQPPIRPPKRGPQPSPIQDPPVPPLPGEDPQGDPTPIGDPPDPSDQPTRVQTKVEKNLFDQEISCFRCGPGTLNLDVVSDGKGS
jgi:hypothetical protein